MKMKGIPAWEQYIEYIVLGVALLVLTGFGAKQLLSNPNVITVQGKELAPGQIEQELEDQAEVLWSQMREDAAPALTIDAPTPVAPDFENALAAAISPADQLALSQESLPVSSDLGPPPAGTPFMVPVIPTPHTLVHQQYFDGIEPATVEDTVNYPTLGSRYFPNGSPYDATWVTAAATFDVAEVLDQMSTSGPGGVPHAIPTSWYDGKVLTANVVIERQELSDGVWSNLTELEPIEGQVHFGKDLMASSFGATQRDNLVEYLSTDENQRVVVQPPFYPTINSSWTIPSAAMMEVVEDVDVAQDDPNGEEIRRLRRQIDTMDRRIQGLMSTIEALGGTLDEPPTRDDDGDSSGGGSPPGLGGGMQRGGNDRSQFADRMKRYRNTMRLRSLEGQLEDLRQRLQDLVGITEEEEDIVEEDSIFDREQILIWGHDMNVEAGKEYRYRFTVEIVNPFFARGIQLIEDQQHLAQQPTLASKASEWSAPIRVAPPIQAFVTNASVSRTNNISGRRASDLATVEVYRFFNGRWWKQRYSSIEPGQRIGDTRTKSMRGRMDESIDFATNWFVLDIVPDLSSGNDSYGNGMVMLQDVNDTMYLETRRPVSEHLSFRRQELNDQVEYAEFQAEAEAEGSEG